MCLPPKVKEIARRVERRLFPCTQLLEMLAEENREACEQSIAMMRAHRDAVKSKEDR